MAAHGSGSAFLYFPGCPATAKATAKTKASKTRVTKPQSKDTNLSLQNSADKRDIGLTVRIEVNLLPAGDQDTYDRIFRSIRENLLNAK